MRTPRGQSCPRVVPQRRPRPVEPVTQAGTMVFDAVTFFPLTGGTMTVELSLIVNGQQRDTRSDPDRPLLDVVREDWGLTGTKYGCGEGQCGACTVLVEGRPMRSCITAIAEVEGSRLQTIEGLAEEGRLHPLQQAFIDQRALQCGYCVPGQILTAVALLRDHPQATRQQIVDELSQHICRCCNYANILAAIEQVAARNSS